MIVPLAFLPKVWLNKILASFALNLTLISFFIYFIYIMLLLFMLLLCYLFLFKCFIVLKDSLLPVLAFEKKIFM